MTLEFALGVPDLSALRAGNTGVPGVWQFASVVPGRHVMVTALVHGNELCGAWALKGLLEAGLQPARGTLTVAFCNLAAFDRFDPKDHDASRFVDEDLNRQWSADRLAEAGTLERRRAAELGPWVAAADWLLDLHSMHEPEAPLCLPGPLAENTALALQMKTPAVIVIDEGHSDGVRMRDFAQFGAAAGAPSDAQAVARALLVECGFHGDPQSVSVAQDQCVRFLALSGIFEEAVLAEKLGRWKLQDTPQKVLQVTGKAVVRQQGASFVQPWRGLDVVDKAGTVIGHDGAAPITTPHDDCVLVMPSLRQARPGVTMVRFARRVAVDGPVLTPST